MAYVEPTTVWAPRTSIRALDILYNSAPGGPGGWSIARVNWDHEDRIGIRWNGGDGPGVGNPQSRGNATWFILPPELDEIVLNKIEEFAMKAPGGLLEGYSAMSQDEAREREAEEWTEGLIGDASAPR